MTKEKLNQVSFSSSFFAKLISFMLGIGCFYLLGSGEMLTFVASKVQADFFIPPFLFKLLLFLFGVTFLLAIFSHININQHAIGSDFLLAFVEPISWENIEKIDIKLVRVKRQDVLDIRIVLKKGCYGQRRIFWFFRQRIDQWCFSWPLHLKSKKMTMVQAIEQFASKEMILQQNLSLM